MSTPKKRKERVYWKDGLQALQQKEETSATRQRHWTRLFAQAEKHLASEEEAVVFLGTDALQVLRQNANEGDGTSHRSRPPLKLLLGAGASLAASLAGYALSYNQIKGHFL